MSKSPTDLHREAQRAYLRRQRDNPDFLARRRETQRLWRARNPEKIKAHDAVKAALKRGELTRPTRCERCHKQCKPEASHDDYSRKLEVEWLCRLCHVAKDTALRTSEERAAS